MIYHDGTGTLDGLQKFVDQAVRKLSIVRLKYDSIIVQGMSGVIVGVPVSMRLNVPLVIVRKNSDDHHGGLDAINAKNLGNRTLFLDDFIGSGTTRERVKVWTADRGDRLMVGQYEYCYDRLRWLEEGVL